MKRPERQNFISDTAYELAVDAFVAWVLAKSFEHTEVGSSVGEFIEDTFDFDWDD